MKITGNNKEVSFGGTILMFIVLVNALIAKHAFTVNAEWYWALLVTLPLLILAFFSGRQKNNT